MEYVPGLKPQQEEGQGGGRRSQKQGRTPVKESQSSMSLRPSASPGNYYNRPAQPQKNQRAEQFIQALGQVSDVSGRLGEYMYEKQKKEAEVQAQQEIQAMSLEEASEKVRTGEIDQYDNPYFQDAFQRQYGIRLGLHKGREMRTEFETGFDPRNDDVDGFIQSQLDSELEQMTGNPIIQEAFTQTVQEDVQQLREKDYSGKAAAIEQDKLDGAYETGVAQFDKRIDRAKTPEQRQQAIDEGYQAWRDGYAERRELLGLSNAEQDALTMQLASRYAREGSVDVVEKLLVDERGGVGAIINKRGEMGADAAQLLNTAEQQFQQDNEEKSFDTRMTFFDQASEGKLSRDELVGFHKQNPGAYTDSQVQRLIATNDSAQDDKREQLRLDRIGRKLQQRQSQEQGAIITDTLAAMQGGTVHRLDSVATTVDIDTDTGEVEREMLSPEDRIAQAEEVLQSRVIPDYAAQFPEEEQGMRAFQYEVGIYANNPEMENTGWKRTLEGVQSALTAAGNSGEVPPKIKDGYTLYKNLKATAPGMLDSLITDQEKDTYEALRLSEQYMGLELDQAVQQAYQIQQNADGDNKFASTQYQEMEQAINSLDGTLDGWGTPKNDGYVTAELGALARHQAMAGGTSSVDSVVERFKEEHDYINGWAVTTRGQNVPVDFKGLAEERINQYAADHQDELEDKGLEASDLTIFPMGGQGSTGAWAIVDATSATPMGDMISSQFTMSDLKRSADEARERMAAESAERARRGVPNAKMEADPDDPRLQGLEEAYENGNSGGAFDINAARDRLLNPDGQTEEPEEESVMDIDMSGATHIPSSDPRPEDLPAFERIDGANAKLPDSEDPGVRQAVETAREANMTKAQFDQYVKGIAQDEAGNGMIFNPRLRERIRYYLPAP